MAATPVLKLISIYRLPATAPEILYQLLQERTSRVNISHHGIPTWQQHLRFIARRPYAVWYLIRYGEDYVGAIYLTAIGEIGVGLLRRCRDFRAVPAAIEALIRKHPRDRFLANINPRNTVWLRIFCSLNFKLLQRTYELRSSGLREKRR